MEEELINGLANELEAETLRSTITEIADGLLNRVGQVVTAEQLGLDGRAGSMLWRGPTWIAAKVSDNGRLRYYGGFEYVTDDCVVTVGEYVFYFIESKRVEEHWSRLEE